MRFFARILFSLFLLPGAVLSQTDSVLVHFVVDPPFATNDSGKMGGIEIEIMNEYVNWLRTAKRMNVGVRFVPYSDSKTFYSTMKSAGKNAIGIGGEVLMTTKAKEVEFTVGYLKNVAVCVTNGNAPDMKSKSGNEVVKTLGSMTALTIPGTILFNYVEEIKKLYVNDLKSKETDDQTKILDEISRNVMIFGYVEAIEFWYYLKKNPTKFLKMQKLLNQDKEQLVCIVPKGGKHKALFNEFFSGPGGFKTQKTYRSILERHMGSYMTQNMAVN